MFDVQKDRKIREMSEALADSLNRTWAEGPLRDANDNLKYGQYDGFVSNIVAVFERKMISLTPAQEAQIHELIKLMEMESEIDELRQYLAERPNEDDSDGR